MPSTTDEPTEAPRPINLFSEVGYQTAIAMSVAATLIAGAGWAGVMVMTHSSCPNTESYDRGMASATYWVAGVCAVLVITAVLATPDRVYEGDFWCQ